MNFLKYISISALIIIASSCASPSQFSSNYEMTNERIFIDQGKMSVAIPSGFMIPVDPQLNQFEFWLINKDLTSTLSLNKINIDHKTVKSIYDNRLATLLKYSKVSRKAQFGKDYQTVGKDEYFNFNNLQCAAFQMKLKGNISQRVIVFKHKNNYYELVALASSKEQNTSILTDLYNAQNTMLNSIK